MNITLSFLSPPRSRFQKKEEKEHPENSKFITCTNWISEESFWTVEDFSTQRMLVMEFQIIWFICKCFEQRKINAELFAWRKVDSGMQLNCYQSAMCVLCKHFGFCFGAIFHVKLGVLTNRTWYHNIYFCGWTVRSRRIQIQPKSIRIGKYGTHNKLTKAKAKRTGSSLVAHLHFFDCCINTSARSSYLMSALQIYILSEWRHS